LSHKIKQWKRMLLATTASGLAMLFEGDWQRNPRRSFAPKSLAVWNGHAPAPEQIKFTEPVVGALFRVGRLR
jgi:hypothetical protein